MLSRPAEGGTGKHVLVHMLTRDPATPESRESMPPKTSAEPSGTVIQQPVEKGYRHLAGPVRQRPLG